VNPADEVSLLRTINLPPRGIGASSIEVLMKVAVDRGVPLWTVLPEAPQNGTIPAWRAGAHQECCNEPRAACRRAGTLATIARDLRRAGAGGTAPR